MMQRIGFTNIQIEQAFSLSGWSISRICQAHGGILDPLAPVFPLLESVLRPILAWAGQRGASGFRWQDTCNDLFMRGENVDAI